MHIVFCFCCAMSSIFTIVSCFYLFLSIHPVSSLFPKFSDSPWSTFCLIPHFHFQYCQCIFFIALRTWQQMPLSVVQLAYRIASFTRIRFKTSVFETLFFQLIFSMLSSALIFLPQRYLYANAVGNHKFVSVDEHINSNKPLSTRQRSARNSGYEYALSRGHAL